LAPPPSKKKERQYKLPQSQHGDGLMRVWYWEWCKDSVHRLQWAPLRSSCMTVFLEICLHLSAWWCFVYAEPTERNTMAVLDAPSSVLHSCLLSCTVTREPARRTIQWRRLSRVGHYQYCCQENRWTDGVEDRGLFGGSDISRKIWRGRVVEHLL